jgi:hypothetical protein
VEGLEGYQPTAGAGGETKLPTLQTLHGRTSRPRGWRVWRVSGLTAHTREARTWQPSKGSITAPAGPAALTMIT